MARRFISIVLWLLDLYPPNGKEEWLVDLYLLCTPNGKEEWLLDDISIVCP